MVSISALKHNTEFNAVLNSKVVQRRSGGIPTEEK